MRERFYDAYTQKWYILTQLTIYAQLIQEDLNMVY